jgi:hypothetical protein
MIKIYDLFKPQSDLLQDFYFLGKFTDQTQDKELLIRAMNDRFKQ